MLLLTTALEAMNRAHEILEFLGPTPPPSHRHWQQARVHLVLAIRELERVLELKRDAEGGTSNGGAH